MNRCKKAAKLYRIREAVIAHKRKERGPLFNDEDLAGCHKVADGLIAACRGRVRPFNACVRSLAQAIGA